MSAALPRVIFVNRVYHPSTAATAQLLTDLAEGLAARGWPVQIIAAGDEPDRAGVTVHRTGRGEQHRGLLSRAGNYWRFLWRARGILARLIHPGDVVVLMTDPPMLGTVLAGTARRKGARVVHWLQDIYPEIVTGHAGALSAWPLAPLAWWRNAAWRTAQACVTLGTDMAATVTAKRLSPDASVIAPNWAPREMDTSAPPAAIAARRAAWGLADKFIVAYSGNLGRVHEFTAVIDAAARLATEPGIAFVFIGAGARFPEVQAAVAARGLTNVHFLPPEPRESLAAALAAADTHLVTLKPAFAPFVYPSKLAGVLAAGRPVLFVGPPDGEIARLLAREKCGAAFAPTDATGLASAIAAWRADSAGRAQLGRAARAAYERYFTLAAALARWEEILRQAAMP